MVMSGRDPRQFAVEVARIAHDNKSEDLIALDLHGISPVTDFTVICTGTSDRQMRAVADMIIEYAKKRAPARPPHPLRPYGFCGQDTAAWIVIDFVDVVIHIFDKPHRDYYDLELLWGDAPRVDWARSESA